MSHLVRIDKPGVYDLDDRSYHADPCPEPSVSSGIVRRIARSPLHAWNAHPRLNPDAPVWSSARLDFGSAAHAIVLGKGSDLAVIDQDDWRLKATREAQAEARKMGLVPVLRKDYERALVMADVARSYLPPAVVVEQAVIWTEVHQGRDVWCRCKPDAVFHEGDVIFDYKTVGKTAEPRAFARHALGFGYDQQAAFYQRGHERTFGVKPRFIFIAQEIDPPYAVSLHEFDELTEYHCQIAISSALGRWATCLETGMWPGYGEQVNVISMPQWKQLELAGLEQPEEENSIVS